MRHNTGGSDRRGMAYLVRSACVLDVDICASDTIHWPISLNLILYVECTRVSMYMNGLYILSPVRHIAILSDVVCSVGRKGSNLGSLIALHVVGFPHLNT